MKMPWRVASRAWVELWRTIPPVTFVLGLAGASCTAQNAPSKQDAARWSLRPDADIPDVVATVGGAPVTRADIRERVGDQLDQIEAQYARARHRIVQAALDSILVERVVVVEARKHGRTLDDLLMVEAGGSLDPTAMDISAWYSTNQARLGGRTLDQLRPQIADLLRGQRRQDALKRLQARLYTERKVVVSLEPYRATPGTADAPVLGPDAAPVTIVEFSDFECPYCGLLQPTLKKVEREFPGQVRLVFRQFPLTQLHPGAFKAAEAALCANEQARFWDMHDLLFQDQKRLTVADLQEKASRLGLDRRKFDSCLDSGRFVEPIRRDRREGVRLGIAGTPALFVNGIPLEGAVPYDTLAALIRRELERVARR